MNTTPHSLLTGAGRFARRLRSQVRDLRRLVLVAMLTAALVLSAAVLLPFGSAVHAQAEPPAAKLPALTASIANAPESHDGQSIFTFELRFSEELQGFSYKTLRDRAFTVTGGTVTKARRLEKPSNIRWEIQVTPASTAGVNVVLPATEDCEAERAICTVDGRPLSNRLEVAVSGPPLTASFGSVPGSHDGQSIFTFELHLSEEIRGFSYRTLQDHAFTVTGGSVTKARRLAKPSNIRWEIQVTPASTAGVKVVLPATEKCEARGAICTADGRSLSNRLEVTVNGPGEPAPSPTPAPTPTPTPSPTPEPSPTAAPSPSQTPDPYADVLIGATYDSRIQAGTVFPVAFDINYLPLDDDPETVELRMTANIYYADGHNFGAVGEDADFCEDSGFGIEQTITVVDNSELETLYAYFGSRDSACWYGPYRIEAVFTDAGGRILTTLTAKFTVAGYDGQTHH